MTQTLYNQCSKVVLTWVNLELTIYFAANDSLQDLAFISHLGTGFSPQPRRYGAQKQFWVSAVVILGMPDKHLHSLHESFHKTIGNETTMRWPWARVQKANSNQMGVICSCAHIKNPASKQVQSWSRQTIAELRKKQSFISCWQLPVLWLVLHVLCLCPVGYIHMGSLEDLVVTLSHSKCNCQCE